MVAALKWKRLEFYLNYVGSASLDRSNKDQLPPKTIETMEVLAWA